MERILKQDNPFFELMSLIGDLFLLNILWIVTSLPIVTIGASTSSLFYIARKILKKSGTSLIRNYFKAFKENFLNATVLWVPLLFAGILLFISTDTMLSYNIVTVSIYIFLLVIYLVELIYVFALQATFVNTPFTIAKNAFITAFGHFKITFFLFAITYIPMSITLLLPKYFYLTFILWVVIGFSLTIFLQAAVFNILFKEYIDEDDEADDK